MTDVSIEHTAQGQVVSVILDEDQSDAIANGELVRLVLGTHFDADGIEDGRRICEISITTAFDD